VPPNVMQQIYLWEGELNCIQAKHGLLIEFETKERWEQFIDYAKKKRITVYKINAENKLIVVDTKYEKEAYEFTFM
jgi:hypothetical protein